MLKPKFAIGETVEAIGAAYPRAVVNGFTCFERAGVIVYQLSPVNQPNISFAMRQENVRKAVDI